MFLNKSFFYSGCKKIWVVENCFLIVTEVNVKKNPTLLQLLTLYTTIPLYIRPFHFIYNHSTLYTTTPLKLLLLVLSEVIYFAVKTKVRKRIGFSKTSIYWTSNETGRRYLTKQTLINVISFLISKCFFNTSNMVFKQDIDIPMSIDPATFSANLLISLNQSI